MLEVGEGVGDDLRAVPWRWAPNEMKSLVPYLCARCASVRLSSTRREDRAKGYGGCRSGTCQGCDSWWACSAVNLTMVSVAMLMWYSAVRVSS